MKTFPESTEISNWDKSEKKKSGSDSEAQDVIDSTCPDLYPTQKEIISSSHSDETCNATINRSSESLRTRDVMDVEESKWLRKAAVLGVLTYTSSLTYHVCSKRIAEKLQAHDSLVF